LHKTLKELAQKKKVTFSSYVNLWLLYYKDTVNKNEIKMNVEIYSMDRWYITPALVHYNDFDLHGYNSIDLVWLKWGIGIIWNKKGE